MKKVVPGTSAEAAGYDLLICIAHSSRDLSGGSDDLVLYLLKGAFVYIRSGSAGADGRYGIPAIVKDRGTYTAMSKLIFLIVHSPALLANLTQQLAEIAFAVIGVFGELFKCALIQNVIKAISGETGQHTFSHG